MSLKKSVRVTLILTLALFAVALAACGEPNKKPDGPINKPGAVVEQDLGMFDTIPHYGIQQIKMYSLTIDGDNASFSGGVKTVSVAEKALLPEITVSNGEYIVGIKNVNTGKVIDDFRFRMPSEDTKIEVLTSAEKPAYFKELMLGNWTDYNSAANANLDWNSVAETMEPNGPFTMNFEYSIESSMKTVDVNGNSDDDYLRGVTFTLSGVAGNMARILTFAGESGSEEGIIAGQTYTFTYNFQNFGENTISFRMYQVQTSIKLGATADRPKATAVNAGKTITLAPGESASYNIAFTAGGDNANIIPVIELRSVFDNEKLAIAIAKENKPLDCAHDIKLIEAQEGDCGKAGNIAYYGCDMCGGMWRDDAGETEVSMLDITVKHAHTSDTYCYVSTPSHRKRCDVCHGVITNAEEHVFKYRVVKEPTADELGIKEEVCDCGYKTGKTIEYQENYTLTVKGENSDTVFDVKVDTGLPAGAKQLLGDKFCNADDLTEIFDKETFIMPEKNITVINFDKAVGDSLTPAEATVGGGYHSQYEGGTANLVYKKDSAVNTEDGKVILGREISMSMNNETATVRIDSQYLPDNSQISVNRRIYNVTIENRNKVAVKFDITQVNSGVNPINGVTRYNDVKLEPGQSGLFTFVFPDNVGVNSNALTVLWFKEMTLNQSVVLGIAISHREYDIEHTLTYVAEGGNKTFKVTGGKALSAEIKAQLPESFYIEGAPNVIYTPDTFVMPFEDATIAAVKKQKFTVGDKTYSIKAGEALPDEAKALLSEEFYNVNNLSEIFVRDTFVMPAYDLSVANLDAPEGNPILLYQATWWTSGTHTDTNRGECVVKKEDGGALRGRKYLFENGAGRQVRIASPYSANGSSVNLAGVTFHITLENKGSQAVTFGLAQVNSSTNKIAGCYDDNITLQAGQSKEFTFTFPTTDPNMSNGNALTVFSFGSDTPAEVVLGMAISYEFPA